EINAFSRLMLHTAIQQAKSWHVEGKYIPIAVNLSPYNLLDNQLVEFIQSELEAADLAPELLAVELTESATMFDVNLAQRVFTELRDMGIKISIDDFGTGMSSMSYLQILPIDCVKLDRSFIENIQTDKVAHAIVSCMVSLCHTLGKTVVAEGVETESQSRALREIGCDQAQGYLFARPLRVNDKELIDWFRAEVPAIAMDTGNRA
ncbi:EAL domain-containing protein, partial [Aequoribacter sp.]|uniref:EAL domain-containing protein n=1 Tax=Aequoribacter sp. TaxID=2847771 RepID=UPI003F696EEB